MRKLNCWELKKGGRESGGLKIVEFGACPAAVEQRLDGTHGGKAAGRACWIVSGILCRGRIEGTFAKKYGNCEKCDFYKKVRAEEGLNFLMSPDLLPMLR
jgi:hypothetical protein